MKNLSSVFVILALSLAPLAAHAQQSAPTQPSTPRVEGGYVVEVSALSAADRARPEWSQQLALVNNSRASARYTNSRAVVVDLTVAARSGEGDRVVIELDVREERSDRAGRSSQQTRQSIAIRRGETQLVQSQSPDGTTRLLRLTVR